MIWNTLKFGAQLVKDGLFWICHSGSQALFWLDSWYGHPLILTTHPQLHALYQSFSDAGWDTVNLYKIEYVSGLAPSFHWKHPSEWPLEVLRRIGRSCFRFCSLVSVLLWLVMIFLIGIVKICLENF